MMFWLNVPTLISCNLLTIKRMMLEEWPSEIRRIHGKEGQDGKYAQYDGSLFVLICSVLLGRKVLASSTSLSWEHPDLVTKRYTTGGKLHPSCHPVCQEAQTRIVILCLMWQDCHELPSLCLQLFICNNHISPWPFDKFLLWLVEVL